MSAHLLFQTSIPIGGHGSMTDRRDGGRWALAGYLYQIVGLLSITAQVSSSMADSGDDESDDISLLLDVGVGEANDALVQAHHEQFGEDALFQVGDKTVLAQFKYSTTVPPNPIDSGELKKIIAKLDNHAKQVQEQGKTVTACILVTNRGFTSQGGAAKELWENEQAKDRTYELRRLPDRLFEHWVGSLREFAGKYGATEEEGSRGIDRLVGRVLMQTCEQTLEAPTFKQDLVEAFTGDRDAWPLTAKEAAKISRCQLEALGEYLRVDQWKERLVNRSASEEILRETQR